MLAGQGIRGFDFYSSLPLLQPAKVDSRIGVQVSIGGSLVRELGCLPLEGGAPPPAREGGAVYRDPPKLHKIFEKG